MGKIVSKAELAKILGKDEKTIFRWLKEGMPVEKQGARGTPSKFDTQKVIEWLISRSNNGKEMDAAKLRLTEAQARKAELEADVLEGTLIPQEKVKATWTKMIASMRSRILALPSRLAPQLVAQREYKKVEKLLKETIYEALQEIADYDPAHYRTSAKDSARSGEDRSATT